MQNLIFINGTMGVGKSAVCRELKKLLPHNVFLDGDHCWDMTPFTVNETTCRMVLDNICALLNSFLKSGMFENILFCWVMHERGIIDEILSRLSFPREKEKAAKDLKRILPRLVSNPLKEKREKACLALRRDGYEDEVIFPLLEGIGEDEEKVLLRLGQEASSAYRRLQRKYNGRELNERVYEALARKGYRPKDIRAVMERLSNDFS